MKISLKAIGKKVRAVLTIPSMVMLSLFVAALIVSAVAKTNVAFADFISRTSGVVIRGTLAYLTCLIPISFAEYLLLASPLFLVVLIVFIVRRMKKSVTVGVRSGISILSVISLVYTLLVFGYSTGYYGRGIDEKMSLERRNLSAEELYETASILIDRIAADVPEVVFPQETYSVMPYSYDTMNNKLLAAYDRLSEKYPEFQRLHVPTKPVMLSKPWTYTHISGTYVFFTGEANVNTNYPDFIMVSSAAHEMAHQRGVTKEDECNFLAFVIGSLSDDPYVRYCCNADVLQSVMNSLYSASPDLYAAARARMPKELKAEYAAYSKFFDEYRENKAAEVTNTVNNAYITSHNQPAGVRSYGLYVDLVAAYLLDTGTN